MSSQSTDTLSRSVAAIVNTSLTVCTSHSKSQAIGSTRQVLRRLPDHALSTASATWLRKDKQLLGGSPTSQLPPCLQKQRRKPCDESAHHDLRPVIDAVHPRQRERRNRPRSCGNERIALRRTRRTVAPPHASPPRLWCFSKRVRHQSRSGTRLDALGSEVAILAAASPNSLRNRSSSRTARGPLVRCRRSIGRSQMAWYER